VAGPEPPADDPDVALMRRFQAGDELAFAQLVERHQQRVWNVAARYVGRGTDCEDLAQEVFLRVWRHRTRWQPTAKFTTWLYQITANLALNWIRDRKRRSMAPLDGRPSAAGAAAAIDPPHRGEPGPGAAAERAERAALVQAAIDALPENQRLAVLLFRQEGLAYQEVAEAMRLSLSAVKSLLNRAKSNLRKHLEPILGDLGGETSSEGQG
jgi:RNA polymerase sigma-70 factor (ECF subfamily)